MTHVKHALIAVAAAVGLMVAAVSWGQWTSSTSDLPGSAPVWRQFQTTTQGIPTDGGDGLSLRNLTYWRPSVCGIDSVQLDGGSMCTALWDLNRQRWMRNPDITFTIQGDAGSCQQFQDRRVGVASGRVAIYPCAGGGIATTGGDAGAILDVQIKGFTAQGYR